MKGSQIIFVFVFALCVASQKEDRPPVYPLNSFGSNGQQQFYNGIPVTVPVEPARSPNISASTSKPSRYPPPPPPPPRQPQPQPINPFGSNGQQQYYNGKPISVSVEQGKSFSQSDNPFDPRDNSGSNNGRPSVVKQISQINDEQIDFNVEPQIAQDDNSNDLGNSAQFKTNNLQKPLTFDPNDFIINLNTIPFVCQSLKYFAFRTGTNNDATRTYLNPPKPCSNVNFYFTTILGQPYNNQLFRGYQIKNLWLFESKVCPGYFIRVTPSNIVELTFGAYGSSLFIAQKNSFNHVVLRSFIYPSTYWRKWWTIIITSPFASNFMMQYWPQF